jgi:hypothetical protein
VISFAGDSAKFGTCTVVSVNGTLVLKIKCVDSRVNVHILASTSVPFSIYTYDGASAKFCTSSQETDNSLEICVPSTVQRYIMLNAFLLYHQQKQVIGEVVVRERRVNSFNVSCFIL